VCQWFSHLDPTYLLLHGSRTKQLGFHGAKDSYRSFKALGSIIPSFINQDYKHSPGKIICGELGLSNLIAESENDLTIVWVVDFKWSYVGPSPALWISAMVASPRSVK
jgi:hypothetical protein